MQIRLLETFGFDHCEIPAGIVMDVPAGKALELIRRGVAEMAEPIKAVVEPEEIRVRFDMDRPQRGRPRKAYAQKADNGRD